MILAVSGIAVALLFWGNHDVTPNPCGAGEWRTPPDFLIRLLRRDAGPVLIGSVFGQVAGLTMIVVGLLTVGGPLASPYSVGAAAALMGAISIALASWVAILVRARIWRRTGRSPDCTEQW